MFDDRLTISAEQQKLISNATRIQILHLLKDEALTAKQVATKLNKSTVAYIITFKFYMMEGYLN